MHIGRSCPVGHVVDLEHSARRCAAHILVQLKLLQSLPVEELKGCVLAKVLNQACASIGNDDYT